jgi:hypothetical protein
MASAPNPYERLQMIARLRRKWIEEERGRDRFLLERDIVDISAEWMQQALIRAYEIDANAAEKVAARRKRGAHG